MIDSSPTTWSQRARVALLKLDPIWADRALLAGLAAYPIVASVRAWTVSDDAIMVLLAIIVLGSLLRHQFVQDIQRWVRLFSNPLGYLVILMMIYGLITLSWAEVSDYPRVHLLKSFGIFAAAIAIAMRLRELPSVKFQLLIAATTTFGLLVVLVDQFIGYKFVETFYGPAIDRRVNPNIMALALLVWPAIAALALVQQRGLAWALWVVGCVTVFRSPNESAMLGYVVGSLTLAVALALPRASAWIVTMVAAAGLVLAPALPQLGGLAVHGLPQWFLEGGSAASRIEIWAEHSALALSAPIFGHGALFLGKGHSHNFPLQLWVEFGALGVAILVAMIVVAGHSIRRAGGRFRPFVLAAVAALYSNMFTAYGVWEIQFLSMLLLSSLVVWHGIASWQLPDAAQTLRGVC